jgi:ketosteroid isomerase-like protein
MHVGIVSKSHSPRAPAVLLAAMLVFNMVNAAGAATTASEERKITDALVTMYAAATTDDLAKFHTVAAADFYAFDNGERFVGDELMQLIRALHASGAVYEWHVTEPQVHISGNTAWITYVNRGSVQNASGKKDMTWLESAFLRKESGSWRIVFFHSTRAP